MTFVLPNSALADSGSGIAGVLGWSFVLIALILLGFFAVSWVRNWLKRDDTPVGIGFSLSDLRELHREGKMTDEEFERARAKIVSAGKEMADKLPDPLAGRRTPRKTDQK